LNRRFLALGRLKAGQRNQLEARYEQHLQTLQQAGEILWYRFEGIKLRLADDCFYTPDFAVMLSNGELQIHECKSIWRDDAKVKMRVAAELYPFAFVAVYAVPKRDGGGFRYETF
jgi:hypothetical protein